MSSTGSATSPAAHAGALSDASADVIVVGAGPGGSATAAYLADHGLDVLLLEKSAFPRDKICGDGLTPRATKELISLGVDTTGWQRTKGLRIKGGGHTLQLDWPENDAFPSFGMVRTRAQLDETLARHAQSRGAKLEERTSVTAPVHDASGRVVGVTAKKVDDRGRATGETVTYRAPVVVASDGVSSRLATAVGRHKREDRVMGVAVRAYYTTPKRDDYLESHLELWTRDDAGNRILMPGYGWLFPLEDGRTNVGLGTLDTTAAFQKTDYKDVMHKWVQDISPEWQLEHDESAGPIRGAALPMGFNRSPLYADGLVLVGDAGGMVNPFNGEGIDYALEAARLGAELIAQAHARPDDAGRERVLASYPKVMKDELGGYFTLGRWFAHAIGNPEVMRLATKYGLPRTKLMPFLLKIMANLADPRAKAPSDRIITALSRLAPDA
ncbi:geranylgeranyl reductase family protein [Intrasporangium sp. YIM S08009]|uniref:geranylgeranyl reductase family protein n=1 Tax=Intrasporangium zincisolvens TaxID=3080018 RepID=UPI002B05721F|nr:geranylgeranyl reductase family protein [Intrasporangium sp. YIM S08009]